MLGSYYKTQALQAIRGVGDVGQKLNFAEEALQEILTGKLGMPAVSAIGVFTPWGVQTGDVTWQDLRNPEFDLIVQPLNDRLIAAAESAAFGHPVGWVGILTERPVSKNAAERAFDDTPYALDMSEGIYDQADVRDPPRIRFLYWGKLREPDDAGGGRSALAQAAQMMSGQLVFPLQVPRANRRPHPAQNFQSALDVQMGIARPAALPSVNTTGPAVTLAPAASSGLPWWAVLGVGAAAAWGGWKLLGGKR